MTYSSSYASSVCGGADGLLLKKFVSGKCLPALWFTLIVKCANRSSHLVNRALYVLMEQFRLISGSNAWWSVGKLIGLLQIYNQKCSNPQSMVNSSSSLIAYFGSVSDRNLLAKPIGFSFPFGGSGHNVAPRPFALASVVITFG